MKFVSTREVRNNPSEFRETVEHEDVVLTANGKPFAIAVGVEEDDLAETMDLLRQVRALRAMARMQKHAAERGLSALTQAEVEEEIRAARQARGKAP
ncbi:MAG: type II toxin-antitoxin system Phd/YefM family antitoxin [Chloroflexota bacterium]|nr:type II toxin-antitoxin system Phd/YefM family antitoxin [Chloroflexota bacterium]